MQHKVAAGEMEPGMIMVDGKLLPIWDVPYSRMIREFERLGAKRAAKAGAS